LKVKQLEIELHSMRTTVNSMHEALQKKTIESDKLRKDLVDAKDEIEELKNQQLVKENLVAKLQESEAILREQSEDLKIQQRERERTLTDKNDEIRYLKSEVEKGEEIKKETDILKERLRQLQSEFDASDKNWDTVDLTCCEMTSIIQGLISIQGRLKQAIPASTGGE